MPAAGADAAGAAEPDATNPLVRRPDAPALASRVRRASVAPGRYTRGVMTRDRPGSWRIAPVPFADVRLLAEELGVSEVLAQVLVRRGLGDAAAARAFLHPDFRVHDPYLMGGMAEARRRVDKALQQGEPIAVHGDYDADGITATFLLVSVLEQLGADVRWRLPNRFSEGYGVSAAAVEELAAAGVKLLVTVDCGISARDEVARRARSAWTSSSPTITRSRALPDCIVVTPKRPAIPARIWPAWASRSSSLTRCSRTRATSSSRCRWPCARYTDVVAMGTIADVVPLVEENRVLTAMGLGRLRSAPRPGLAALLEVAGVGPASSMPGRSASVSAPRLNAAGRLEDASLALELLGSPTATRRCRSRSGSTSSTASDRPSRPASSRRRWPWSRTRRRRHSCSPRPTGTRAWSASSRRASRRSSTVPRSC